MKEQKKNWYLSFGLLTIAVMSTLKIFFDLPHFAYGIGLGLGLVLELTGLYTMRHDLTKFRNAKFSLLKRFVKMKVQ